jgi:chromate transporter
MPTSLSPRDVLLAFIQVGLSSIGGAVGPLRYVLVIRRRWLTDLELAEGLAISQALPGAAVSNLAVMIGDRFAGTLGALGALLGLCGPPLVVALVLGALATRFSATSPRFAAAETAVTAAIAGIFIANGLRLARRLWRDEPDTRWTWRGGRVGLSALAAVLVAGLHVSVPIVMVCVVGGSFALETAQRRAAAQP